jgi:hypothetical protein
VFLIWHDLELSFQNENPLCKRKVFMRRQLQEKNWEVGFVHTDQSQMLLLPIVDIQQDCKPCLI